ncbi:hypothetical protein F2P56_018617, partial [Juglans regia]
MLPLSLNLTLQSHSPHLVCLKIMSSHSNLFHLSPAISCILPRSCLSFKCVWSLGAKDHKRPNSPLRCCPISKPGTGQDGFQHEDLPVIKWREVVEGHTDREADDVK